jgi:uncharacterized OsmC-like protein
MKIVLESETGVRVSAAEALAIEAADEKLSFSPFHMLAAGLTTCTFSVLYSWARNAGLSIDDLEVAAAWSFDGDSGRVERYRVQIVWPSLPEARHAAATKAAAQCTVHHTLEHGSSIDVALTA